MVLGGPGRGVRSRWAGPQLEPTHPAAHSSVTAGAPCPSFEDDAQSLSGHSRDSERAQGQTPGMIPHVPESRA